MVNFLCLLYSDPDDADIIYLLIVSPPALESMLKQLILFFHGLFLNGQKQFLKSAILEFFTMFSTELINKTTLTGL